MSISTGAEFMNVTCFSSFYRRGSCSEGGPSCVEALAVLQNELERYMTGLSKRSGMVIGNKIDLPGAWDSYGTLQANTTLPVIPVCGVNGRGVRKVTELLRQQVEALHPKKIVDETHQLFLEELFFSRYHKQPVKAS